MKELIEIQSLLKAPKNRRNSFGGFNYRSTEDILDAVKPLLQELSCVLTINDEIVMVGTRFYVKATATLVNSTGECVSTSAFAREEETRSKMDAPQLTGSSSSYARKYALNGLFCIDDAKDPDTDEYQKQKGQQNGGKSAMPAATTSQQPQRALTDAEVNTHKAKLNEAKNAREVLSTFMSLPPIAQTDQRIKDYARELTNKFNAEAAAQAEQTQPQQAAQPAAETAQEQVKQKTKTAKKDEFKEI